MSANKLISFGNIDTAKKMALLNIEAKKFIDAETFINAIKEKDINSYNYLSGVMNAKNNNKNSAIEFFKKIPKDNINYIGSINEVAKIKINSKDFSGLKEFFKNFCCYYINKIILLYIARIKNIY